MGIMEEREPKLTLRQDRAVNAYIRDEGKSQAQALREAGYSKAVTRQPHKVFGSPAVVDALEKRGANYFRKAQYGKLESTIRFVEVSHMDFPLEQRQNLKELLDAASGDPIQWRDLRVAEDEEGYIPPSYIPQGVGTDVFSAGAKCPPAYSRSSTFSSM
jgi:hypothetical protein